MHPERQKLPTSEFWWQNIRHSFLQNVDDQDEDEEDDQRQEADVDAQVVGLVDEGEAHHVAGKDDEHEDQVKDGEPPDNWKTFVIGWRMWVLSSRIKILKPINSVLVEKISILKKGLEKL